MWAHLCKARLFFYAQGLSAVKGFTHKIEQVIGEEYTAGNQLERYHEKANMTGK